MRLYDPADGVTLIDADSTPTVAVRKNGSSVGDSVTVGKRSATTGIYDCSYNPASEVDGDQFTLEESAVIDGDTYQSSFAVMVVLSPLDATGIRAAVGLADDNLDAQLAALAAGTGAYEITITASDQAAALLSGATITLQLNDVAVASGTTNGSGVLTLNVANTGTYRIVGSLIGHSYGGQDLTVDGNETAAVTFTSISISPPADPGFCTFAVRCWNTAGAVASGVTVYAKVAQEPTGTGEMFTDATLTAVSGADGYATFTVPKSCTVNYWRGTGPKYQDILGTDSVEYANNAIGSP